MPRRLQPRTPALPPGSASCQMTVGSRFSYPSLSGLMEGTEPAFGFHVLGFCALFPPPCPNLSHYRPLPDLPSRPLFILVCHFPWGTVKGRSKKAEQEATDLVLLHPVEEVTGHDLHRVRRGTITRRAEMHHAAMSDNPSPLGRKCSGVEN